MKDNEALSNWLMKRHWCKLVRPSEKILALGKIFLRYLRADHPTASLNFEILPLCWDLQVYRESNTIHLDKFTCAAPLPHLADVSPSIIFIGCLLTL